MLVFQSLGRDSVCSYLASLRFRHSYYVFQSLGRDSVCSYAIYNHDDEQPGHVSIPRSGFCLFIPVKLCVRMSRNLSFNPSVGILFVHTWRFRRRKRRKGKFQSLGRDSVCSYAYYGAYGGKGGKVSIPRSGFCLFILAVNQSRA